MWATRLSCFVHKTTFNRSFCKSITNNSDILKTSGAYSKKSENVNRRFRNHSKPDTRGSISSPTEWPQSKRRNELPQETREFEGKLYNTISPIKNPESPLDHGNVKDSVKKIKRVNAFSDETLKTFDKELNLTYVRLPYDHPQLQAFMLMTKSKVYRAQKHQLMVEGRRLLIDALEAGLPLEYVLFSKIEQLKLIKDKLVETGSTPKIIRVPHHDLSFWSVLTTCPGIIGIFTKPMDMSKIYDRVSNTEAAESLDEGEEEEQNINDSLEVPKITVILDQIREPNNLGSVIRTCAAIPCHEVILTKGCADPWETKALRGGAGGHFRIPIRGPMHWDSICSILPPPEEYSFYIADNGTKRDTSNGNALSYIDVSFKKCQHVVLVIGGETEGISSDAYRLLAQQRKLFDEKATKDGCGHHCIHIPLANKVESLNSNAAASILLFEIRRQMQITRK